MREAQSQNKDLSRQVQELLAIRHQLEADRDRLSSELNDANEALRDAQARLDAANAALSQLKLTSSTACVRRTKRSKTSGAFNNVV